MKPFLTGEICELLNGKIIQGTDNLPIASVTSYPETMKSPCPLLFLKRRWQMDWTIIQRSAPCSVVTEEDFEQLKTIVDCTVIRVKDIDSAYWSFVEYYRSLYPIPVIAVTGTSGKTTTKDMIRHILKYSCNVQGTENSANGRTGHLLYLLRFDSSTDAAVFETAVGKPGDITYACRHFKPSIGIITNIGIDHLDECKTVEGYIKAKSEILTAVGDDGILILNADDENIKKVGLEKFKGRTVYYGINNKADFQASDIRYVDNGMEFVLKLHQMHYKFFVPGYGEHQVYNVLAASAAVHELGIGMKEAADRLRHFQNMPFHLQQVKGKNGCLILDDTWNSNPTSLRAAISAMNGIAGSRKRVILLGHINALGNSASEIACQIGDMITELGAELLIAVGPLAEIITGRVLEKDFKGEVLSFQDSASVYEVLERYLDKDTIMLAKCSMFDYDFKALLESFKQNDTV